jgi:hypothetical protein
VAAEKYVSWRGDQHSALLSARGAAPPAHTPIRTAPVLHPVDGIDAPHHGRRRRLEHAPAGGIAVKRLGRLALFLGRLRVGHRVPNCLCGGCRSSATCQALSAVGRHRQARLP